MGELALGAKLLGFGKKYWLDIVVALAVAGLITWAFVAHRNAEKRAHDAAYADGINAQKAIDATAIAAANARANAINSNLRTQSDEENHAIDSTANAQRLHGPGKAVCPRSSATPSAASGRDAPAGTGPSTVAGLPDSGGIDLIALPFADTVSVIQQCALNRSEALKWRESDQQQSNPQEK